MPPALFSCIDEESILLETVIDNDDDGSPRELKVVSERPLTLTEDGTVKFSDIVGVAQVPLYNLIAPPEIHTPHV